MAGVVWRVLCSMAGVVWRLLWREYGFDVHKVNPVQNENRRYIHSNEVAG